MRSLVLVALLVACGPTSSGGGEPDATTHACFTDVECGPGKRCEAGTCIDNHCGGESLELTYTPPNLLLVLDRSCSMRNAPAGSVMSKWEIAVAAIKQVLADYGADIQWGLTLFPDITPAGCTQQDFAYPLAPNNAAGIDALLTSALSTTDALYPDGPCVTNIDTGLQQAATDPALNASDRESYIMLVTDGAQSGGCTAGGSDAGSEAAVHELYSQRGIKTFVIGFGGAVDVVQLDKLAVAGGAALPGATKYYQADTAGQLDQALQAIANQVIGCSYEVDPAPLDLAQTYVWFEKSELVPHDPTHMAGWDFDPATGMLTLYGMYCDRLKSKAVDTLDVIFGCPSPPVL
jgi:hypothetical protein